MKKYITLLRALSFLGMLVTAYLTYQHFAYPGGKFCNVNDYVSCDIVNKSIYAEIFGVPVAILGLIAYTFFFLLSFRLTPGLFKYGAFAAGLGLLFSLYLTLVEFFVLNAVCIFCVTQQILILFIFLIFLFLWRRFGKSAA